MSVQTQPEHSHDHAHDHDHGHDHSHDHRPAGETPPAGGPVVLDIGDDVGAVVVHVTGVWDDLIGYEIHARPCGSAEHSIHTGIWPRAVGSRQALVAVFPELDHGTYELLNLDGTVARLVTVSAGVVSEVTLALEQH